MMSMTEMIRREYMPETVRLLLIGESPPAKGWFFYRTDHHSRMTTYTARAFSTAHSLAFPDMRSFLNYFKACGCYLDDLCLTPVDNLSHRQREEQLKAGIEALSQRIREMNPAVVAVVLRKIENHVGEAIRKSGCNPIVFVLPFPGNGHQNMFIDHLCELVREHVPLPT